MDKFVEHAVYIDELVQKRKASDGCIVDSWRVTYQNGKEADRMHLYTDTYEPEAQQMWVGMSERPDTTGW